MNLSLVFWDWSGTLITGAKSAYTNSIYNDFADKNLSTRFILIKESWFLVDRFLEKKIKQVIVSNGTKKNILSYLTFNPFDLILTAEEFYAKPDVSMLQYASEDLKLYDKSSMILIGDSVADRMVAKNFGIKFFLIDDYFFSAKNIAQEFCLF